MHEMSLCEGIVQIIEGECKRSKFNKVSKVFLEIGALSGVEISALEFCYEVVCRNTVASGSELTIERVPGMAWCLPCARQLEVESRYSACPDCGSFQLQVTGGDQMRIKELEVI